MQTIRFEPDRYVRMVGLARVEQRDREPAALPQRHRRVDTSVPDPLPSPVPGKPAATSRAGCASARRVKAAAKPAAAQMEGIEPEGQEGDHDGSTQSGGGDVDLLAQHEGRRSGKNIADDAAEGGGDGAERDGGEKRHAGRQRLAGARDGEKGQALGHRPREEPGPGGRLRSWRPSVGPRAKRCSATIRQTSTSVGSPTQKTGPCSDQKVPHSAAADPG